MNLLNKKIELSGIDYGNATAGVVGAKKPLYDIWGHAVNMASRLDTTGQAGKIQVKHKNSGATYHILSVLSLSLMLIRIFYILKIFFENRIELIYKKGQ